jgi:ATP-dependent Lon protease
MGDHQREFFLREQLKAIQSELGEADDRASEISEYREKIHAAKMPEEIEARALKELDRFEKTPLVSPEAGVLRNYLDLMGAMPWSTLTDDRLDILEAERILDEDHYGLPKVKERILEFLAVRKLAGEKLKAPILCFVGPPGVGKTSLGRSVARALGRKFARLSLGGVRDEAEIRGHRRTYVGAMPGRILQAIRQAGSRNPVIVLDEIDKLGNDFRGDPSSALLEALDPEQNKEFSDHYLEVPFDLSQALFIATANLLDTIPPALRDRLEVISFSGYIEAEKKAIAQSYLLPRQRESHGLTDENFTLSEEALLRLIREYTREAGVRNLHREMGSLCRKAARKIAGDASATVTVDLPELEALLGKPRYDWGKMEEADEVGAATGLVYTEAGGDTVTIEVLPTRGEGKLTLTGQLGEVMRESAQTAWTFVRSRLTTLGIPEDADKGKDIHVHVPAGAVPKDGPSAGVTMAVALASAIGGRPVRRDVAMTGEITLRGKVLPVGGIKEKVLAAHRSGIRTVLLPYENEKDLDDLPADVRAELTFVFLRHADDALKAALVPL